MYQAQVDVRHIGVNQSAERSSHIASSLGLPGADVGCLLCLGEYVVVERQQGGDRGGPGA